MDLKDSTQPSSMTLEQQELSFNGCLEYLTDILWAYQSRAVLLSGIQCVLSSLVQEYLRRNSWTMRQERNMKISISLLGALPSLSAGMPDYSCGRSWRTIERWVHKKRKKSRSELMVYFFVCVWKCQPPCVWGNTRLRRWHLLEWESKFSNFKFILNFSHSKETAFLCCYTRMIWFISCWISSTNGQLTSS